MEKRRHQVVQEAFTKLGYRVKPEQMTAIEAFISGMDVFVTFQPHSQDNTPSSQ